jgi:predicted AlkP superfamily phosphohydrolase/phosphomutase
MEGLGFQIPQSDTGTGGLGAQARGLAGRLRNLVPPEARSFVNERVLPEAIGDRMYARYFAASFDWQRSRAFFLPSDHFQGFIRVNVRGREPWGIVERGADYDEVCDEICRELGRLINPSTGIPAIQEVVRIQQTYAGSALDTLPDLVIRWAEDAPISALCHPRFGTIRRERFKLRKTQHGPDGFMIATGKHINRQATVAEGSTMDLAPTILHLLGQPIPRDMDGRVLVELLDDDFTQSYPCIYEDRPFIVPEEMRV